MVWQHRYVLVQAPHHPGATTYELLVGGARRVLEGSPHAIGVTLGALLLLVVAVVAVSAIRYRLGLVLILLGPTVLSLPIAAWDWWVSGTAHRPWMSPPRPMYPETWEPGAIHLALSVAVSGLLMVGWRHRRKIRGLSVLPAAVAVGLTLLGARIVLDNWQIVDDFLDEAAQLWRMDWLVTQYHIAGEVLPLIAWIGRWFLAESLSTLRPSRVLAVGGGAVALALTSTVILLRPPTELVSPGDQWPAVPRGRMVPGLAVSWVNSDHWSVASDQMFPDFAEELRESMARGDHLRPAVLGMSNTLQSLPMTWSTDAPVQEFVTEFVKSHPEYDTTLPLLTMSSKLRQRPLTLEEADSWIDLTLTHPTNLALDVWLLGNLVESGRGNRAEKVAAHIRGNLDALPPVSHWGMGFGTGSDTDFNERYSQVLGLYESMLRDSTPEPDVMARSLEVRMKTVEGLPMESVPVCLFQAWHVSPSPPEEPSLGPTRQIRLTSRGRCKNSGHSGTVKFSELTTASYGVAVLSGWPGSGLTARRVAVPTTDLPSELPPGLTVQEWIEIPAGTFEIDEFGMLVLDPPPTGPVVAPCPGEGADGKAGCDSIDLTVVYLDPDARRWDSLPAALFEAGPEGRPVFVWLGEETYLNFLHHTGGS